MKYNVVTIYMGRDNSQTELIQWEQEGGPRGEHKNISSPVITDILAVMLMELWVSIEHRIGVQVSLIYIYKASRDHLLSKLLLEKTESTKR